ncbi:class I SAM-dependent DNA methyltransferase [Cryobacterium sp. 1639]|uniref:Eco57I restriction-modification methylase domain-containing protein n=1 Tax=Cryobacterium inferilacus TaxID=2866629 RepID=UPI001C72D1FB|nr:DNA methyltransferase [Cryobacterium sp. 1639]MBX0301093.1 class I SAM-dependent DNA methyltransferase [Cryobacterium sp. 1639]
MASDAFIVGEEWISEHFFNTDSAKQSFQGHVVQRRKAWDADSEAGTSGRDTFLAARRELAAAYAALESGDGKEENSARIAQLLKAHLGFDSGLYEIEEVGAIARVSQRDLDQPASVVIIDARPVDEFEDLLQKGTDSLAEPVVVDGDDKHPISSVPKMLSLVFAQDDAPRYALVLAGRWVLLTERQRWPEGRYLAINMQLVIDRNDEKKGGELDRALACITADSLMPDAEGAVWWDTVFDDSIKHTVGVSKDLREGVRNSIEIIANEVVRRRALKGLKPLPEEEAQPLAKQALRYLYRILFLLFAEASPELKVLPIGDPDYEIGYSLDRLRELVLVELSADAADRTHFHDSLSVLFRLVDRGHGVDAASDGDEEEAAPDLSSGLVFNGLSADLFLPRATASIDEVGLGDEAMRTVLAHLLLSKEQKGRDRGFISYSDLGINQLGAVYEGLMSYTGFFATTDLHEVAKDGDASKGSWVVPVERSHGIEKKDFVTYEDPITGEVRLVLHEQGSFVFRLAGRERQQSASFYTPEVLTRFVVSQALEELLDQDGRRTTAAEILRLTVCEPALGSGAFAIEAVRQLAEEYLKRREEELGERVDPEDRPRELQKVKASIALHQVYGVDLNATAVELAEITLWLDTMVEGLTAPWFGLHLRRGNSLIGSRRAVYSRDQVNSKGWLHDVPRDVPVAELADNLDAGRVAQGTAGAIHHFLLPASGWGSAVDAKEAKELAPEALAQLKAWRRSIVAKPSKKQLDRLVNLSYRVETLWQFALRRLQIAEREARREIELWGADLIVTPDAPPPVPREEIEFKLADPDGAYQRLRRVMDAWNALWFWPLTDTLKQGVTPPTLDGWLNGVQALLGSHFEAKTKGKMAGGEALGLPSGWSELGTAEELDLAFAGAQNVAEALAENPWLRVTERIAGEQGFFHWQLDFAPRFATGGFDLQIGNPPWVRPRSDVDALLAEGDPWWQLAVKPTQAQVASKRAETLSLEGMADLLLDGTAAVAVTAAFLGDSTQYPHLAGLQPDLYRCFMDQTWRNTSRRGSVGLIHPESHFTDEKAGILREATYGRLRRHWQFVNELSLFEVHHLVSYGVHVYGAVQTPDFLMATSLYHPETVAASLRHDGSGEEPGLKDREGKWDLRPHAGRITSVTDDVLQTWHAVLEDESVPVRRTRMVYAVNRATAEVLRKLSAAPRIGQLGLEFSRGWDESIDRRKGFFDISWGKVDSWRDAILQGPHLFVGNPFYKSPNETMLHNQDWSAVDLDALAPDALPVTAYKPAKPPVEYDAAYTHWGADRTPARDHYRIAWRRMAANTGQRTLISAPIPKGAAHVHPVYSIGLAAEDPVLVAVVGAFLSTLPVDFMVRTASKAEIPFGTICRLPVIEHEAATPWLLLRYLRLSCLTDAYAEWWAGAYSPEFAKDSWAGDYVGQSGSLAVQSPQWDRLVPLRSDLDRRQAQLEIDVIVALLLGLTVAELCAIYQSQFPVLNGYDRNSYLYDANGRLVPSSVLSVWRSKGDGISDDERRAVHPGSGIEYTYELPFRTLDREADMRQAYAHFEKILKERS